MTRREEIKFSSSLRPSTRSNSVIPLSTIYEAKRDYTIRVLEISPATMFGRGDIARTPRLSHRRTILFWWNHCCPTIHAGSNPRRYARTIPKENSSWLLYAPCHSICGYTHTRPSDLRCYPTTPSASPPPPHLSLFLFFLPFVTPFLLSPPFSCCFVVLFINFVRDSYGTFTFFALAISNSIHPHTIHLSIQSIHTYTCLHHPYMFIELVNCRLILLARSSIV
jgi:hypothetical protein